MLDEERAVSPTAAAKELGVARRTIYRDLMVLQEIGMPLYQESDKGRPRWRLVEGPRRRLSVTLSWSEMLALTAGRDLLAGLAGTFFHEAAITALEKIRSALPPELGRRAEASAGVLMSDPQAPRSYRNHGDAARVLAEAIERRETVVLEYRKLAARAFSHREVDPYHLHIHAGALYVIGWCHERKAVRTFLLDRAGAVRPAGRTFERRSDLALASVLQGDLGPWSGPQQAVELGFSPDVARLVAERKVHPSQKTQWRSDGGLDVTMLVPVTPWFERWLLGWGAAVDIRTPKTLRRKIEGLHRDAIAPKKDRPA